MNPQPQPASLNPIPSADDIRRRIDSDTILCGASSVEIDHAGQRYLLRVTRENKLILTK
ncbi:MAG TPA: hemin uptake protein HemP [Azonexus sp.]|nr:hemin uptake protein HemP [Azonexus sp.]